MPKSRSRKKKPPKRVLALPDLEHAKTAVLNSLTSASGQRTYDHAIREFVAWYCSEPRLAFNRTVVLRYRIHLEQRHYAPATIDLRLAAVRRVAYEAADAGLLSPELAAGIRRVKGVRRIGVPPGELADARTRPTAPRSRAALDTPCVTRPRDGRDADWLRAPPRRAVDPSSRLDSAAGAPLGDCRPGRQGWTHPNGPDPNVGEDGGGRVDGGGGHYPWPGLPCHQQDRTGLGRWHVTQGAVGCRARSGGARRHRQAGASRPPAHLRPPNATWDANRSSGRR